ADPQTNVNLANRLDETPLMYLAIVGQTARARTLIQRGAKVNRLGWTPLHYAASTGQLETAKMLLADKAIVNAPGPDGTTPLMMAALSGSDAMVRLLLHAGADPTMRNLKGQSAADWARQKGFNDLAAKLDSQAGKVLARRRIQREKDIANQAQTIPVPELGGAGTPKASSEAYPTGQAADTRNPDSSTQGIVTGVTTPATAPAMPSTKPEKPANPQGDGTSRYFNLGGPVPNAGH
ncbi:MAG TPA: ankyrin repeat domain-containing protein, partial [Burkholderiaceae bacterium]|nr:ankyrin repeat domain-containing protein [Burkholderiaceae bacterium]